LSLIGNQQVKGSKKHEEKRHQVEGMKDSGLGVKPPEKMIRPLNESIIEPKKNCENHSQGVKQGCVFLISTVCERGNKMEKDNGYKDNS
jgi:hypothetical protein